MQGDSGNFAGRSVAVIITALSAGDAQGGGGAATDVYTECGEWDW